MSYDLKYVECVNGLDMITPQSSIHFHASEAHAVCYVWFLGGEISHKVKISVEDTVKCGPNVVLSMVFRKFENCCIA